MKRKKPEEISGSLSSRTNTKENFNYLEEMQRYFEESIGTHAEKMAAFVKFVPRQRLTDFLSLYEIFRNVLNVQGSVVDCGVYLGRTLMTYAQLSAILEPMNYQRKIIGFETFKGFLRLDKEDDKGTHDQKKTGGFRAESYDDLVRCIRLFDSNRFLNHIPKVVLVKGDIEKTAPQYLEGNPHTVVSLLSLDLSLYAPTKAALKAFLPRMPKGAVITFGEMNCSDFCGEVTAVLEEVGLRNLRIQRNPFDTVASYTVLE
ncbi:MAG: class I SAM-dependent methyltransferase [Candidatus Latescibacteria bacterium]|nr:class I SAM-dependent methyltransferase [Candidatus Latescibacterota bacterium]